MQLNDLNNGIRKDKLTPEQRSELMAKVTSTGSKAEAKVRKALFAAGFRYRKNVKNLPGKPDIVLAKYKAIVFVHGCFWHQHPDCREAIRPATRLEYWQPKLSRNIERDQNNAAQLRQMGWRVFIIWECELRSQLFQKTMENLINQLRMVSSPA